MDINQSLDLPKEQYIEKIENIGTWGGGIELKIFSDMFQVQIASIDVQSNRVDIFGEDKRYPQRIYVVYNGVHYDPLVFANSESSKDDITIFESDDNITLIQMQEFCKKFKESGDYVDLGRSQFRCSICNLIFNSQEEAIQHSTLTSHVDFQQV